MRTHRRSSGLAIEHSSRPTPVEHRSRHRIDLASREFQEMRRELRVDRETPIDEEARTVELSFASEQPVRRWFGDEVLEITPAACDLTRLNDGGAVLVNHNWDDQIGVIERAWLDRRAKKARALIRFSRSERGEEIFRDIADGIRSLVSVGYIVRKMELQSVEGDVETHRVTDWQPFEVSVVPVPADSSVGVGRALRTEHPEGRPSRQEHQYQTRAKPASQMSSSPSSAAERSDAAELVAAAAVLKQRFRQHREAIDSAMQDHVANGLSVADFQRHVVERVLPAQIEASPIHVSHLRQIDPLMGMTQRETSRYSLLRAISLLAANKPLDGLEGECSTEEARRVGRSPRGFFVPQDIFGTRYARAARGLAVNPPSDGGYTVASEVLGHEMVELLRNQAHVLELGARFIPGLVGNVTIPTQKTGAVAYWVSEGGTIGRSSATFGQIAMLPRRLGASTQYTREFLAQTSLEAEDFTREDILKSIALELDRVAIAGNGGAEPRGILNLEASDRSASVTFGGAATLAKALEFQANVGTSNALDGRPAYLTTWATKSKWQGIARFSGGDTPLWASDEDVCGYRGRPTAQLPSTPVANQVIFGDFSQVIYGQWAGVDIIVDPYSAKREGVIEITIQQLIDMIIRKAKAFAISTDTGAA